MTCPDHDDSILTVSRNPTDPTISRFIVARKGKIKDAIEQYVKAELWRKVSLAGAATVADG